MTESLYNILGNIGLEPGLIDEIKTTGRIKNVQQGQVLMTPDHPGNEIPIVLNGLLKVIRQDPDGHEVFLYYIEGGETCAMSITSCIENKKASFKVSVEEDSTILLLPMQCIDQWVGKYVAFRRFVFASHQMRFDELLHTIDGVVFHKMDERLYRYLLDTKQATGSYEIHKTHEQIASALNTSRVVISRLLKQLEKEDKIAQHRSLIEVL